jgi:acetolactate synthase-1/2/3 large subunit
MMADQPLVPQDATEDGAGTDGPSAHDLHPDDLLHAPAAGEEDLDLDVTVAELAEADDRAPRETGDASDQAPQDIPTESQAEPGMREATDGHEDAATEAGQRAPSRGGTVAAPARVRRTVSAEVARQMHRAGARYCFTVPGEAILPLLDDLAAQGIRVVTTRHESGAAFMAEALAQSTGRPQLVAVSRVIGAASAAIGIHAASQDSAPLVVLAGQLERAYLGREAFGESDLVAGIGSLATWANQVDDPDQAVGILASAARRLATGRPGPILLSLPRDVMDVEIEVGNASAPAPTGARGPAADRVAVRRVLKLLAASERGVIVAGGGVLRARATKRLVALSEALAVPVIAAWRRPDVFPNDHPNYLGMAGTAAPETVRQRLEDADVIVFIGARLSEVTTYRYAIPRPGTSWAHVDIQPRSSAPGLAAPAVSVEADASRFLDAAWSDLRAAALDNEMRSRREARTAADREAFRAASAVGQVAWGGPGVHPGHVVDVLRRVLPDNAVITTDAGNMGGWLARGFRFRRAGTFIGAASGAMGFGLPAAVAASLHEPDRIAVALCGDGGFAISMMELETAVREGAHPIVLVFDNERFGTAAMRQSQEGRSSATSDLGPIDAAAVARAHGALGARVANDAEFEDALREAIASRQTSVIHLVLDRAWVSVDDGPLTAD